MAEDKSNNSLVKVPGNKIARYSNALVRRAITDLGKEKASDTPSTSTKPKVLFVAAKEEFEWIFTEILKDEPIELAVVESYNNLAEIYTELERTKYDLIIPTNTSLTDFATFLPRLIKEHPYLKIIVCSGWMSIGFQRDLKKLGIENALKLPFEPNVFVQTVKTVLTASNKNDVTLLLSPRLHGGPISELFEALGFKVVCSENIKATRKFLEFTNADLAIEWQGNPQDYSLRDLLKTLGRVVPTYLALNWNGKINGDVQELGYVDTLKVPFQFDEMWQKFREMLTPIMQSILEGTEFYMASHPESASKHKLNQ